MKKVLFTFILCSMLSAQISGFANIKIGNYPLSQIIEMHGSKPNSTQRVPVPAQVSLLDHQLMIQSCVFESDFTVTIIEVSTSKIIYEQTYGTSTKNFIIDLGFEKSGEYKIQFVSAEWFLYGDFSL